MIQKQTVTFRFGAADADTGDKHVKTGDLVLAQDVRMTNKRGRYSKRVGFVADQTTFSGGTFGAPATDIIGAQGGGTLIRDSSDQLWAEASGSATYIGMDPRPWSTSTQLVAAELSVCRPKSCVVGSNTWYFTVNNGAASYYMTVVDTLTGTVVMAAKTVGTSAACHNIAPVYDGTNVWVFYVCNNTLVYVDKFTPATPGTRTANYTYATVANATNSSLDARYMPGANSGSGRTYVVYGSGTQNGSTQRGYAYSYLNTATGAATSQVIEGTLGAAVSAGRQYTSVYILEGQTGAEAYWYFAFGGQRPGVAAQSVLLVKVDSGTFAKTSVRMELGPDIGTTSTTTQEFCSVVTGFCQSATIQAVIFQTWSLTAAHASYVRADNHAIYKATVTNGTTWNNDTTKIATGWIASGPWQVGSNWYFLSGYDDGQVPMASGIHLQQSYHVRDSSGNVVSQVLPGEGAGAFHIEASPTTGTVYTTVPRVSYASNFARVPITVSNSNISYCSGALLSIDYAKQYGKVASFLGKAVSPGPVPIVWSSYGFHEIAPLLFPSWITAGSGGVTVATAVAIRYVIVDPDGTLWRGAPTILVQNMAAAATITYPTLRHKLAGTTINVEIYLANTLSTTPYLQTTVANDPSVDQQTYTVPAAVVVGESLDTFGGALAQSWPQPCQALVFWRNRLVMAHQNHIHYSQEMQDGFGPVFNEVLTAIWAEAAGDDIRALCPVNYDYLGAWCAGRIAVISGPGPDGAGRGNYQVMPLNTLTGVVAANSVVQGPDGAYFYDATALRLCVLTPALAVKDAEGISRGFFDYADECFGLWWEEQRMMVWTCSAKPQLVLDYGNRTESCPLGRMYRWTLAGFNGARPGAAAIVSGRVRAMDSNGDLYLSQLPAANYSRDVIRGVTQQILKSIKTAWLQPLDLQGEFSLRTAHAIYTWSADSTATMKIYSDYSATASETANATITQTEQQFSTNPAGCGRTQAVQIEITDTTYGIHTNGADFDGITLTIQPRGRAKMLNSGQVL